MRIRFWNQSRKINHLSEVVRDRKNITEFTKSISSTRIGKLLVILDVKGTKDKHISRWVDQDILIYVG